jgi:hypothetical protein
MTAPEITAYITLGLTVLGLVAALIKTTRWGQAHQEALDTTVEVIGQIKQIVPTAAPEILERMSAREGLVSPAAVAAWRAARDRRDPKP